MLSFFWRRQCPWMSLCMHHILSKRGRGLVAIYCLAVPLLGWYFVFIQTQEYDLFSPKPARLPSNTLINQRLLRQPLYNPAIQEIKLPENYCICAHNLQNNANVYNTALHSSQLCKKRRRSITTKKKEIDWEKMLNKAEMSWGEGGEESLGIDERNIFFRGFIKHQMMNPECTLWSWHQLSTHCLAQHSSVLPLTQSPSPPFTDKPFSGENATLMGSD